MREDWERLCLSAVETVCSVYYKRSSWSKAELLFMLVKGLGAFLLAILKRSEPLCLSLSRGPDSANDVIFYHTGNYVSEHFAGFVRDQPTAHFSKRLVIGRLARKSGESLSLFVVNQWRVAGFCLAQMLKLLRYAFNDSSKFVRHFLVAKHFSKDLVGSLLDQKSYTHLGSNVFLVSDEANPLFRIWWLKNFGASGENFLVHLQHGIVAKSEWTHSLACFFLLISRNVECDVTESLNREVMVETVGSYLLRNPIKVTCNPLWNVMVCLQPYDIAFGSTKEYEAILGGVARIARKLENLTFLIRPHPSQGMHTKISSIFNSANCVVSDEASLVQQIAESEKCISFFSQTSYEIINAGKPLALIRAPTMSVSPVFESEFKDHLLPIKALEKWIASENVEEEAKKSMSLRSSRKLGIAISSEADVIDKIETNIAQILRLSSQNDSR